MGIKKKTHREKKCQDSFSPHPSKHTNHESWEIRPSYDMGDQSGKEDFRHTSSFVPLKDFHPSRAQCQEGRGKEDGMGWGSQSARISCRPARYETPYPRGGARRDILGRVGNPQPQLLTYCSLPLPVAPPSPKPLMPQKITLPIV